MIQACFIVSASYAVFLLLLTMRNGPVPRDDIFALYWYFASERQRVFERRIQGNDAPWTEDRILQTYKFCNVYRAADRVSQYLIKDVAYDGESVAAAERLFQIVAFRLFSRIETWRSVRTFLGHQPTIEDLRSDSFRNSLEHARVQNKSLYTGAFILCANDVYHQRVKHLNHIELLRHMFIRGNLGERLLEARTFQYVFELLRSYPLMGNFMSYQIAIDLNYSRYIDFSENDFTRPGPGAERGIRKVFSSLGEFNSSDIIKWVVDRQESEFSKRGLSFSGLWGRSLHAIDCQGLFCEVDKYCREAAPNLLSNRKRIKARFRPSRESLQFFFPPKWGINESISREGNMCRRADGSPQ
jgi:hypothetical protein